MFIWVSHYHTVSSLVGGQMAVPTVVPWITFFYKVSSVQRMSIRFPIEDRRGNQCEEATAQLTPFLSTFPRAMFHTLLIWKGLELDRDSRVPLPHNQSEESDKH